MCNFFYSNKYIESDIQDGFWEDVSGCIEHIETSSHVINSAILKQRSLVITLLGFKNAFGEVNHNLRREVLKMEHVPDEFVKLIRSLYTDYRISVLTNRFMTSPISVRRGVLQGDSLSLLL